MLPLSRSLYTFCPRYETLHICACAPRDRALSMCCHRHGAPETKRFAGGARDRPMHMRRQRQDPSQMAPETGFTGGDRNRTLHRGCQRQTIVHVAPETEPLTSGARDRTLHRWRHIHSIAHVAPETQWSPSFCRQ